ncbi:MAG: FlgD immunoglobulin-like domain containing protein [bacterium]
MREKRMKYLFIFMLLTAVAGNLAATNIILLWDGASAPANWKNCSGPGTGTYYQKFIRGCNVTGGSGGGHSHSFTIPALGAATGTFSTQVAKSVGGRYYNLATHTHPAGTPGVNLTSSTTSYPEPPYRNFAFITPTAGGEEPYLPEGIIALFDASGPDPAGSWTEQVAYEDGKFVRGDTLTQVGTTGGNLTHNHTISSGNFMSAGTAASATSGNYILKNHTHTITAGTYSTDTAGVAAEPNYITVRIFKLTKVGGDYIPKNMIAMFDNTIASSNWTTISNSSTGALYLRTFKPSSTYGTTGGGGTHTHQIGYAACVAGSRNISVAAVTDNLANSNSVTASGADVTAIKGNVSETHSHPDTDFGTSASMTTTAVQTGDTDGPWPYYANLVFGKSTQSFAVEFTGMTANSEIGRINLNWLTEVEKDNCKWILQRSTTRESGYTKIVELSAKGKGPNSYTYTDSTVTPGLAYWYKLGDVDNAGNTVWHTPVSAVARLETNFPISLKLGSLNPSNGIVTIDYSVPGSSTAAYVNITIYNSAGQVVKALVNERQKPGNHIVYWDGKNSKNELLSSGEYFCRLKTEGQVTYKLIRMK